MLAGSFMKVRITSGSSACYTKANPSMKQMNNQFFRSIDLASRGDFTFPIAYLSLSDARTILALYAKSLLTCLTEEISRIYYRILPASHCSQSAEGVSHDAQYSNCAILFTFHYDWHLRCPSRPSAISRHIGQYEKPQQLIGPPSPNQWCESSFECC